MYFHTSGNLLHLGMPAQGIKSEVTTAIGLQREALTLHSEQEGSRNGHETCEFQMTTAKSSGNQPKDIHVKEPGKLLFHVEFSGTSEERTGYGVVNRP